jgi:hypothetical protein
MEAWGGEPLRSEGSVDSSGEAGMLVALLSGE